jgi:nucleoside 2-deoxyribosyltransferase
MTKAMKLIRTFFLAGIIQGSKQGKVLYDQDYRKRIKVFLHKHFPESKIIDPVDTHPNSVDYDHQTGKKVFLEDIKDATQCDCMIAYIPEASMGTAIEMWECYQKGVPVWSITPMKENWAVKFLSNEIFESLDEFEKHLEKSSL